MTTLFLDTEFNEWRGDFISIALVPDSDGEPFYMSVGCKKPTPWVAANVMPMLQIKAEDYETVQRYLHLYLSKQPKPVHIVADWPCDFKYLCELLVLRAGVACSIPLTMKLITAEYQSRFPHNALADARALKDAVLGALV